MVESSRPRISRTPIVWGGSAPAAGSEGTRGRGQVTRGGRGGTARRSRGRAGPRGGGAV